MSKLIEKAVPAEKTSAGATGRIREELLRRNAVFQVFFRREAPRLARASQEMSARFLRGGRLLAFGRGSASTDAQHVSVEFVHPVIVGKRALPALDLGADFESALPVIIRREDMVMGFAFPERDETVVRCLGAARKVGALTFALSGDEADYGFELPDSDPFIAQEVFEVLYHLLWETVHVFFEHREQGHDVGASSFLYPFLGHSEQDLEGVVAGVEASMLEKVEEVNRIRTVVADHETGSIIEAAGAVRERVAGGGKAVVFGNGGSATDANDFVADCLNPPADLPPVSAVSLSSEPANITAVANDVGVEAIFTRQLIAHALPGDVAIGISTSGSSPNILLALKEARKRGVLTVAMAGYDGGKVRHEELADYVLVVNCDYIPRIQEGQASIYHILRRLIGEPEGVVAHA